MAKVVYNGKVIKEQSVLTQRTKGEKIFFTIVFIVFMIQCISLFFPLIWVVLNSFKSFAEYRGGNTFSLPKVWEFSNYIKAFEQLEYGAGDRTISFAEMIFNTVYYVVICDTISAFTPLVTGYVFSKYNFKGKTLIFSIAIFAMMIPTVGTTASMIKILHYMQIYDTPIYVWITAAGGFGATFLVFSAYYKNVSWSYAEAAMIDGAGHYTIFFKIMLPQGMPLFWTYLIIGAIAGWNEYYSILLYLPNYPTIAAGLFNYKDKAYRKSGLPIFFAGLVYSVIPSIILFSCFSDKILVSLSIGGLKG